MEVVRDGHAVGPLALEQVVRIPNNGERLETVSHKGGSCVVIWSAFAWATRREMERVASNALRHLLDGL